jgi:hypothetical protein
VRISFHKISDQQHTLEVQREGAAPERVLCETRSYFAHDLLHYAVEAEARLEGGFWGSLARGTTLARMNDRGAPPLPGGELAAIELVVGALSAAAKGRPSKEICEGLARYAEAREAPMPAWLDDAFVDRVKERLRRLNGAWRATSPGAAMTLSWPPDAA